MNEEYLIDYRVNVLNSTPRIQVLLHKDNPSIRYNFEIQQYMSEEVFKDMPDYSSRPPIGEKPFEEYPGVPYQPDDGKFDTNRPYKNKSTDRWALLFLFIILTFVTIASVGLKQRSVVKARTTYEEIKWAREDWVPPKLELASFRKDGFVVEDLDEVEAAVLIGIPYNNILSMILYKLIDKGYLEEISTDPLRVRQVKGKT